MTHTHESKQKKKKKCMYNALSKYIQYYGLFCHGGRWNIMRKWAKLEIGRWSLDEVI